MLNVVLAFAFLFLSVGVFAFVIWYEGYREPKKRQRKPEVSYQKMRKALKRNK